MEKILERLRNDMPGCLPLVLNYDGFVVSSPVNNRDSLAERLAAMTASLVALSEGIVRHTKSGPFQEVIVKGKKKFTIALSVNDDWILCIFVPADVRFGLAYEMAIAAAKDLGK